MTPCVNLALSQFLIAKITQDECYVFPQMKVGCDDRKGRLGGQRAVYPAPPWHDQVARRKPAITKVDAG